MHNWEIAGGKSGENQFAAGEMDTGLYWLFAALQMCSPFCSAGVIVEAAAMNVLEYGYVLRKKKNTLCRTLVILLTEMDNKRL